MSISTERLFSLPCIEGMRLYRQYSTLKPEMNNSELVSLICELEADAHMLDFEASIYLSNLVEVDCPLTGVLYYQACIKGILLEHQPIWAKLMRQGRSRFLDRLGSNDKDVFAAAGLTENPPTRPVIAWWDHISGLARFVSDNEKIEQGREAEILTLEYEKKRLKSIGISKQTEWPGFDNNFAGYDVLSYDHSSSGIVNRLIEVKSSTVSPLRFIISRNEWEKAKRAGSNYVFHIWNMRPNVPKLHVHNVTDVEPHIPIDSGKGRWRNAEIPVSTRT